MRRNGKQPTDPISLANLIIPGLTLDDSAYATLRMRLDLYDDTILARRYDKGKPGPYFALDPLQVAAAVAGLVISTPPLPRNCLFWQRVGDGERLAIYAEPRIWAVHVAVPGEDKKAQREAWRVPMPGLVWFGSGSAYGLYAVKGNDWPRPETALWAAPVPNVGGGGVCHGNVKFPPAGAATMWTALGLFFESDFNNHLSNGKSVRYKASILEQWAVLHEMGAETYPEDDLVGTNTTLARLMEAER